MAIDISKIEYDVELMTEQGTRYLLNSVLLSLQWEEQQNELAQRASIRIANGSIGSSRVISVAKLNCAILIYAKWAAARQLLFTGSIWEWSYASGRQDELDIVACDNMIRLQQSEDFFYYQAGMTTQAIISDVCGQWGVPVSYQWSQRITHEKKVFNGEAISNVITGLLEEVRQRTGEKYVIYLRDGQMRIVGRGSNAEVYCVDETLNAISTSNKLVLMNLVTKVKVIGREDSDGRATVDAMLDGDLRFGTLQKIVRRDSNKSVGDAMKEARALIDEHGKPEETIQASGPDLPFVRKGDKMEWRAGNLLGFFYVEGISHNATERTANYTLQRA